ncbi:MAG: UDP-glucose 4-epimerase GalE [Mycoplasmatales bacterium]
MNILVTGGCGYIGHYAVQDLLDLGHNVIVVDDLSTGYKEGINDKSSFYQVDIRDYDKLLEVFTKENIDLVMDFAARLIVEESVENPALYYDVNINGLKNVLDCMVKTNVKNIIFSSTAAVHGLLNKGEELINEEDPTIPSNPYGETKLAGEKMIEWYAKAYDLNYVLFRYFNVVGGNKPGSDVSEFTTIVPRIISSIRDNKQLQVFGNDYPTRDGSTIRDFIHVYDLVSAHILMVDKIDSIESGVYNLSIGQGTTILELINSAAKTLNKEIDYKVAPRREGDPIVSAATNDKILKVIDWNIKYPTIYDMIKESYESWT